MKLYVALLCICLVGLADCVWKSEFQAYKEKYEKKYKTSLEELARRVVYNRNKRLIEKFNAEESEAAGYVMGVNHLTDRTDGELKVRMGLKVPKIPSLAERNSPEGTEFLERILNNKTKVPDKLDWRKVAGRVSNVKDQGDCGSCWAFATTGTLEGQEIVRGFGGFGHKSVIALSEQNLVDCSDVDYGCQGGDMITALDFVSKEEGIDDDVGYPYEAVDGQCRFNKGHVAMKDSGGVILPEGDEEKLKKVVALFGPVAVGIDAGGPFRHYEEGVYYNKNCTKDLDHAVLIVGYGTHPEQGDYWIVKNSWSDTWGDKGYLLMARNKKNHCGIASVATIPFFRNETRVN